MATRRPKVPRAAAAASNSAATGQGTAVDGGDVIRADFGGSRRGGGPDTPPARTDTAANKADNKAANKADNKAGDTGGAAEGLDPVPAKAFSGRMLALALVMVAITIMLAPSVKIFVDKRAEIAALQADISAKQAKQTDLKRQVSRWQDPNYVKQQARDRINMVMPGETGYWVFGSDLPAVASGAGAAAGTAADPANLPWVDTLWESIRRSATD
ncbi:septum formation initiator family protein [Arthrobacter sp. UYEF3]|uniref:FtsB family cell division protein n=1 Tax=Arthrobacter sp. UYEF3 TaxID=1756365 RepID=UPI0033932D21